MGEATKAPETIAGRYHVERPIGRGGMGTVWLCRDDRLERDVAVKQIGALPGETAPDLARAMREARSSAALNHPHVVSIYDVVEEDDHIWLVMEYVASRTLAQVIAEDGPLSPEATVAIGAQIAEALAAVHGAGTIHRDIKPANILVTDQGVAKISDFGIARVHDQGRLTRSGLVIGTPTYFSPELARGEKPTPAADVWALGATLYTAVEGHPPYEAQPNALALLATIASSPPPPARAAGFLTEPIGRMLDPDPRSRWSIAHAAGVLERLQERYAGKTLDDPTTELLVPRATAPAVPPAAPSSTPESAPAPDADAADATPTPAESRRRRPGALVVAGLAGLLAVAAVIGFLLLQGDPAGQSSAQGPGGTPRTTNHSTPGGRSPSTSASDPTTAPSTPSTPSSTPPHPGPVAGASAAQFVRSYYASLPADTRTAWAALSPGFRAKIGGYGSYRGFWSTIASVSVGRTASSGTSSVDVSLTYTGTDGGVESEVRRLFLERSGKGYLVTGDAVVG
jgi:eukaryotic-like serine/threonine-protein kinase